MQKKFREFYDENFSRVFAYLYAQTGAVEAAKHLTALTFERASEGWRAAPPRMRRPSLFSIARALLDEHADDLAVYEDRAHPLTEESPLAEPAMRDLIAHLPPLERELISLRFDAGLDYGEISEVLGMTRTEIAQRLLQAIRTLTARITQA